MKIKNIDGLSGEDLLQEVARGARFIYYPYTVSLVAVTLRRTSGVYLVRPGENGARKGLRFTLLSFLFGWWGIPYGPKYTVESLRTNLHGGKDVTDEVMATVEGHLLFEYAQREKATRR